MRYEYIEYGRWAPEIETRNRNRNEEMKLKTDFEIESLKTKFNLTQFCTSMRALIPKKKIVCFRFTSLIFMELITAGYFEMGGGGKGVHTFIHSFPHSANPNLNPSPMLLHYLMSYVH